MKNALRQVKKILAITMSLIIVITGFIQMDRVNAGEMPGSNPAEDASTTEAPESGGEGGKTSPVIDAGGGENGDAAQQGDSNPDRNSDGTGYTGNPDGNSDGTGEAGDTGNPDSNPAEGDGEKLADPANEVQRGSAASLTDPVTFSGLEDLTLDITALYEGVDKSSLAELPEGEQRDAKYAQLVDNALRLKLLENVKAVDSAGNELVVYIKGLDSASFLQNFAENGDSAQTVVYGIIYTDSETAEEREYIKERAVTCQVQARVLLAVSDVVEVDTCDKFLKVISGTLTATDNLAAPYYSNWETINAMEDITVKITANIPLKEDQSVFIAPGKTIRLTSSGTADAPLELGSSKQYYGTKIFVEGTLYLSDGVKIIAQRSRNGRTFMYGGAIEVRATGTFYMDGGSISGGYVGAGGGAVANYGTFNMSGGEITGNTKYGLGGGGGGVYNAANATFNMTGGEISNNLATNRAGVSYYVSTGSGGGVLNDGTFAMSGGVIKGNTADYGGGVHNGGSGVFTMSGGTISGNNAATSNYSANFGYGGGVGNHGAFVMSDGSIEGNSALQKGGGIYTNGNFNMSGGIIEGNTVKGISRPTAPSVEDAYSCGGGGVYIEHIGGSRPVTSLSGGRITGNTVSLSGFGGGIYSLVATLSIGEDFEISENKAPNGGGIGIANGSLTIDKSQIIRNHAVSGGGIFSGISGLEINVSGGSISFNTAELDGGAIFTLSNKINLLDQTEIKGNTAVRYGGGIRSLYGAVALGDCIISENSADYGGGVASGAYALTSSSDNTIFSGNYAAQGLYDYGESNKGANVEVKSNEVYFRAQGNIKNIRWGSVSVPGTHALNNYDIGYVGGDKILTATITYKPGTQGTFADIVYRNVIVGSVTPKPAETEITGNAGWAFDGWSPNVDATVSTDAVYTAKWKPLTGIKYKVEHYKVGADGTATLALTDNLSGETGTTVIAVDKPIENHTFAPDYAGTVKEGTIVADGSLVLKLYYTINRHNVIYQYATGSPSNAPALPTPESEIAVGESRTLADNPTLAGYTFGGWSTTDVTVSSDGTFTMPDSDVTFTGTWTRFGGGNGGGNGGGGGSYEDDRNDSNPTIPPSGDTTPPQRIPDTPVPQAELPKLDNPQNPAPTPANRIEGGGNTALVPMVIYPDVTVPGDSTITIPDESTPTASTNDQQPLVELSDEDVPLANAFGDEEPVSTGAWALANLIISSVGAVLALAETVRAITKKKKEQENQKQSDKNSRQKRFNSICLISSVALGALGIVLFIFTEDMTATMVTTDNWTMLHLAIFAAEMLGAASVFKNSKSTESDTNEA